MSLNELFQVIFLISGCINLTLAGWLYLRWQQWLDRCDRLPGVVVALQPYGIPTDMDNQILLPVVQYRAPDGSLSTITGKPFYYFNYWSIGTPVTVLVDRYQPERVELYQPVARLVLPFLFVLAGILSFIGIVTIRIYFT